MLRANIDGNDELRGQHDVAVMFLQQLPRSVTLQPSLATGAEGS